MYTRLCADRLTHLASQFPAVLILGARQVGKTTLARQTFSTLKYLDLEDAATHALFAEDPRFQLDARTGTGLILDEAQRLPALFDALRGAIDADRHEQTVAIGDALPAVIGRRADRPCDTVRAGHHIVAGAAGADRHEQPVAIGDALPAAIGRRGADRPRDAVRAGHHPVAGAIVADRYEQPVAIGYALPAVIGRRRLGGPIDAI